MTNTTPIQETWQEKIMNLSKMEGCENIDWVMQFEGLCDCDSGCLCEHRAKWIIDLVYSLLQRKERETIEGIDPIKMAEEFEAEMTKSIFGVGGIQGMGNVHLFAQKIQDKLDSLLNLNKEND